MKDNSEPAFPQTIDDMGTMRSVIEGLTKREWFAGMALQGILARGYAEKIDDLCYVAYRYADAMLTQSGGGDE